MFMQTGFSTDSSSLHKTQENSSNLRELACADTSGIGSSNTSPQQSSRPNSEPSGSGSVIIQPLDDQDLDVVYVKKEQEDSPSGILFYLYNKIEAFSYLVSLIR